MNNKQKTKRAPNYTLEEKNTLLSIVAKYQNVIDCKRAWKSVVMEYNSICTTGPREEHMLKHFYNNIKHRARKDSAIKNKKRYLEQLSVQTNEDFSLQPSTSSQAEQTVVVEVANNESKNIKKTGGGSFTPVTENEYQILSVLDNQIHPDVNPYDEAEYFGENVEENSKKELERKSNPSIHRKRKRKLQRTTLLKTQSAEALKRIYLKKKLSWPITKKKLKCKGLGLKKRKMN